MTGIGHNSKAAIHAEFEDVKRVKTRKVWQLIFEVPEERYDAAVEALGGSPQSGESRSVAIALLKPGAAEQPAERVKGGERAKRAGILCNDTAFQRWIGALDSDKAADRVRARCGIDSRAELDHYSDCAKEFDDMVDEFYQSQHGQTTQHMQDMKDRRV